MYSEFYQCLDVHRYDAARNDLQKHVPDTRSERVFVNAAKAISDTQYQLDGPIKKLRLAPKGVTFANAYIVRFKGCPIQRFFYSTSGRLVRSDALYHELGTYFYD